MDASPGAARASRPSTLSMMAAGAAGVREEEEGVPMGKGMRMGKEMGDREERRACSLRSLYIVLLLRLGLRAFTATTADR